VLLNKWGKTSDSDLRGFAWRLPSGNQVHVKRGFGRQGLVGEVVLAVQVEVAVRAHGEGERVASAAAAAILLTPWRPLFGDCQWSGGGKYASQVTVGPNF